MTQPEPRPPRVMFWVQHMLGIGHLTRTLALARACAKDGLAAHVVTGGPSAPDAAVPGVDLHRLPAIQAADPAFSGLINASGSPVDDDYWRARREKLLKLFDSIQPQAIVLEHFPFGRRAFLDEIRPLLHHARRHGDPIIAVSVRDVLVARRAKRWAEALDFLNDHINKIYVHGDDALIRFGATFPHEPEVAHMITYTGYVDMQTDSADGLADDGPGVNEILVSAGGGPVGEELRRAALAMGRGPNGETIRIRVSHAVSESEFESLLAGAASGTIVERNQPDFRDRLRTCACSVSQAGYNTVVDILATGARSVMVPFDAPGETEQRVRAERLAALNRVRIVEESEVTPEKLRATIADTLAQEVPTLGIHLKGAQTFSRDIRSLIEAAL